MESFFMQLAKINFRLFSDSMSIHVQCLPMPNIYDWIFENPLYGIFF